MNKPAGKTILVGISGASGAIYARRLIDLLDQASCSVHIMVSDTARGILQDELGIRRLDEQTLLGRSTQNLTFHENDNLRQLPASGSWPADAMVICPCSGHTLASVAAGLADSLLLRAAAVTLNQRRPLILGHRETPLTAIDLKNMLRVTQAGGILCPANPAFYLSPKSIEDLVDFLVARILDLLRIPHSLPVRWSAD